VIVLPIRRVAPILLAFSVVASVVGCSSDSPGVLTRSTQSQRTTGPEATDSTDAPTASAPQTTLEVATVPTAPAPTSPAPPPTASPFDISQPVLPGAFLSEGDESCRESLSRDLGEPWEVECYQGWASGGPTAYYDECGDCESLSVVQLTNGRWTEVGACHAYHVASCGLENLVPREALCVLWYSNSLLGELWRTGCAPRYADLLGAQSASCADYYEAYFDDTWASSLICLKGDTVRRAQEALRQLGYSIDADGYFGPASSRAVASYQRANGMTISAVLDEPTRRSLLGE